MASPSPHTVQIQSFSVDSFGTVAIEYSFDSGATQRVTWNSLDDMTGAINDYNTNLWGLLMLALAWYAARDPTFTHASTTIVGKTITFNPGANPPFTVA
jgi:hypothetical protein